MSENLTDVFGLNETYVELLRSQWKQDPLSVSEEWRSYFAGHVESFKPAPEAAMPAIAKPTKPLPQTGIEEVALSGIAKKIAENMQASLSIPTATSVRTIPVKVLEENRLILNDHLVDEAWPRCSYTHMIAYAIIKAIAKNPSLNNGFARNDKALTKLTREDINLGLAVDLPGKDGSRTLVVPSIKACQRMGFSEFFKAYNDVIDRARLNKLTPDDFAGTTVTLTNPGGIGTVASHPRLMEGQGCIVAVGSMGYPAEYEATAPETLHALGVGKVMTLTSTYDHRVIQGAESGRFLADVHACLVGENGFYEDIFKNLRIPHRPFSLAADQAVVFGSQAGLTQTQRAMRVSQLIQAYRERGYMLANVDPLYLNMQEHPELTLQHYGLTIWDLDRTFLTMGVLSEENAPFRSILQALRNAYCRKMGVEYMYIDDPLEREWVQQKVERNPIVFSAAEKKHVFYKLIQAEEFEHFLHKRFLGHKRFSIEGGESLIPLLDELLNTASTRDVTDVTIGMAHRGRLNVLANVVGKSYEAIFAEFEHLDTKTFQGSGDVKYHLGAKGVHRFKGEASTGSLEEREIRLELACNPSHLEAVNPVIEGLVRAKQDMLGDRDRKKVLPILIHGDAAFAGQGVVYETLQLSGLQGYRTGGTIHVVVNNQIGYTTPPEKGRTSVNCSDIGRALRVPVLRVNGDDPEACCKAARIAMEYRTKFAKDVIIDMVCYRRYGHNEGDEPSFTQPILYSAIQKHVSVATRYGEWLVRRKDISADVLDEMRLSKRDRFEQALSAVREKGKDAVSHEHELCWLDLSMSESGIDTKVSEDVLKRIAEKTTYDPEVIEIHPRVKSQVLDKRRQMVEKDGLIDFGAAEILAYGSLLLEGVPIRLSGQDCGRGTFAHRHAVLYDIKDGRSYIPLNHLNKSRDEGEEEWHPSRFRVYDSPLSEEAVLGFEYGYSVGHPASLVIWEAQFGDFFNGAQIQIDQFISSGEAKWGQKSRLVLFLPHGYDGQGPEHSSARMERFLQLCAQDNMRIANCSTAGQLFHLIRRQAKLPKKPLVVFSHKSLLRSEQASSSLDELTNGAFQHVIDDPRKKGKDVKGRVVFCSGKIYWELDQEREKLGAAAKHVRLVRVEELYPFPKAQIKALLSKAQPKEVVWLQEEPRNNGAFSYVEPLLRSLGVSVRYIGRAASASPATGSLHTHKRQQETILKAAFQPIAENALDEEVV